MRYNVAARRRGSTNRPPKSQLRQLRKRAAVLGPGTMPGSSVSMTAVRKKRRTRLDGRSWPDMRQFDCEPGDVPVTKNNSAGTGCVWKL